MNVADFNGYDGISFRKLGRWIDPTAKNSGLRKTLRGETTEITGLLQGAKDAIGAAKGNPKPLTVAKPPGLFAPGGWVEQNQTYLLAWAGALAILYFVAAKRR